LASHLKELFLIVMGMTFAEMDIKYLVKKTMKRAITFTVLLFNSVLLFSQKPAIFSTEMGAIRGYDPVAYFNDGKPIKGSAEYSYSYQNATWYFSSFQHLELFKKSPEKYVPQFGGYCAFGMSRGYKAETQPDAWTIVAGKLYLNYNLAVRTDWNSKQAEYIEKATVNWPTVKNK
jgi:YHS domain-containing protein